MVYYTALPLIMQTEQSQGCSNSNNSITAITYNQVPQTSHTLLTSSSNSPIQQQHEQIALPQLANNMTVDYKITQHNNHHQQPQQNTRVKPQFKCEQCHMCFGSKSAHTSHMKSHTKQYQVQNVNNINTTQLSGSVPNSNTQMVASNNGTAAEPYQCDVCKKTFAVPARLVSFKTNANYYKYINDVK